MQLVIDFWAGSMDQVVVGTEPLVAEAAAEEAAEVMDAMEEVRSAAEEVRSETALLAS